jgi:hypothetical protein
MTGQMTLWDYLPEKSLEDIPEEEAVRQIGDAIGVRFLPGKFGGYSAKVGKYTLSCEYDRYFTDVDDKIGTGDLFIGVDIMDKKGCGASAPVGSIQKAIDWFRAYKK